MNETFFLTSEGVLDKELERLLQVLAVKLVVGILFVEPPRLAAPILFGGNGKPASFGGVGRIIVERATAPACMWLFLRFDRVSLPIPGVTSPHS